MIAKERKKKINEKRGIKREKEKEQNIKNNFNNIFLFNTVMKNNITFLQEACIIFKILVSII